MDPYSAQMLMMQQIGQLSGTVVEHVRSVLMALSWVILGLVVAEAVKFLALVLLRWSRWDRLCSAVGWTQVLHKIRPDLTPVAATSRFLFWFSFFSFFMKALEKVGFSSIDWLGKAYFDLLPSVIQAAAILLTAGLLALVSSRIMRLAAQPPLAALGASLIRVFILTLGLQAALMTLGFEKGLVQPLVLVFLAGWVLALVLSWAQNKGIPIYREVIRVNELEEGQ
jgi:hypothetical protein